MILNLILLLYVLPMVIMAVFQYFEEKPQTIGELLVDGWLIYVPCINLLATCMIPFYYISKFYSGKFNSWWEKFKNIKIR